MYSMLDGLDENHASTPHIYSTVISLTHTPFTHPWQTFLFYPATFLNNNPPISLWPQTDPATHANPGAEPPTRGPDVAFPCWRRGGGEFPIFLQAGCFYHAHKHELMRANKKADGVGVTHAYCSPVQQRLSRGLAYCLPVWGGVSTRGQRVTGRLSYTQIYSHTDSLSEKQAVVKHNVTTAG